MEVKRPTIDVKCTKDDWDMFDEDWSMYKEAYLSTASNAAIRVNLKECCSRQMQVMLRKQLNVKSASEDELLTAMKKLAVTEADVSGRHVLIALWSNSV